MKKLLLTLLCVVAAVSSAFADVTYEQVALSDINSGDEVAIVGTDGLGNLYFATPTMNNNTLTCLSVKGSISDPAVLTDAQNGQIQKFTVNKNGSTFSLKNSNGEYLSITATSNGVKWATTQTAFTPINADGGGAYLQSGSAAIGFHKTGHYLNATKSGSIATFSSGLFFFKEAKGEVAVKESVYLANSGQIKIQMEEGKTVTGDIFKDGQLRAILNWGTDDEEVVTEGIEYTYTVVKNNDGAGANTIVTDVISVDANGVITAIAPGTVYVRVEINSDLYKADPVFINVVVSAPVGIYTGTVFKAGENSAFYLTLAGETTHLLDVENGQSKPYKLDGSGVYGKTYYIYPGTNRQLISFTVDGTAGKLYGSLGYFNVKAGYEPKEIIVNTTDEPKTAFNVTGGDVVLCDAYMKEIVTLNEGTTKRAMNETFYICPVEGTRISVVRTSDDEPLTPKEDSQWEYGLVVPVLAADIALGYDITVSEVNANESVFILEEGSYAELWRTFDVSFKNEKVMTFKPGYNYYDMKTDAWKYFQYMIVASEGQELVRIDYNGNIVSSFSKQTGELPGNYMKIQPQYAEPTTYKITTQKTPLRVSFTVTPGGSAELRHLGISTWVTDYVLTGTKPVVLDEYETYYIFATDGYELTEVVGADGNPLTIQPAEADWTGSESAYCFFKASQAQKSYTITAPEKKIEVNPGDLASGQQISFKFYDKETVDLSESRLSYGIYYIDPGKRMLGDGGAVQLVFGNAAAAFQEVYATKATYLTIQQTGYGANVKIGEMTVCFTDDVSSLEKIEFEYFSDAANWITTQKLVCKEGGLNDDATVWTPAAPAAAPSMYTTTDDGKVKSVTFTAGNGNASLRAMYVTYNGPQLPTGIETVEASAEDVEAVYYNLQGVRVENPAAGIYVRVRGNQVDKVLVK